MKIGVFDHMDRGLVPLAEQYETRLRLAAAYDAAGFHMYHVAEHHSTPLGMAPSPGIFFSAMSQRTKRLRFGPLVYPLALYHPLRLAEEIAMLDHLSQGRFEFGIGKGASPHELAIYGAESGEHASDQFEEARQVLMMALTEERVDFQGSYFKFTDVPVEMRPLQQPLPNIWYGVSTPDSARRAAGRSYNFVSNAQAGQARRITAAYREAWHALGQAEDDLPLMGTGRFIVISEDGETARAAASRAYPLWHANFWKLWEARGGRLPNFPLPETFEELQQTGIGIAGSPGEVLDRLANEAFGCRRELPRLPLCLRRPDGS